MAHNNPHEQYFSYLLKRSLIGRLYRQYWLYPRLSRHLKGKTLDIGCGIGDMLAFRPGTIGVDVNPLNVDYCNSLGLHAVTMQPDLIPFEDNSFESILLDNVLEHIDNPRPLMAEIQRVLKPHGILVVGVPGLKGMASDLDHKKYYSESALNVLASEESFSVQRFFYTPIMKSDYLSKFLRQYCIYSIWTPKQGRT